MTREQRRAFGRAFALTFALGCALLYLHAELAEARPPDQAGGIKVVASTPYLDSPKEVRGLAVVYRTRQTREPASITMRLFRGTSLRSTFGRVFEANDTVKTFAVRAPCHLSRSRGWWLIVNGFSRGRWSESISLRVPIGCT